MKFSIITVTKNSAQFIDRCVLSVKNQNVCLEHIIKDDCSSDNTIELALMANKNIRIIQNSDVGIYDAMNQGFLHAKGDIVGFLNSDDYYMSDVLSHVLEVFNVYGCDFVYGDIVMVNNEGVLRWHWRTGEISVIKSKQIPHPALFVKRSVLKNISGPFDSSYNISADLKLQLILVNRLKAKGFYLPSTIAVMQLGGKSTSSFFSYISGWVESYRAWNEVHKRGGIGFVARKVASKLAGVRL